MSTGRTIRLTEAEDGCGSLVTKRPASRAGAGAQKNYPATNPSDTHFR
jgi:hypothetical protein